MRYDRTICINVQEKGKRKTHLEVGADEDQSPEHQQRHQYNHKDRGVVNHGGVNGCPLF